MRIGEFIKQRRERLGITQKEIADMFGWGSPQFISNFERGIADPPLAIAKKLAKKLKVKPEVLRIYYMRYFKAKLDKYL